MIAFRHVWPRTENPSIMTKPSARWVKLYSPADRPIALVGSTDQVGKRQRVTQPAQSLAELINTMNIG